MAPVVRRASGALALALLVALGLVASGVWASQPPERPADGLVLDFESIQAAPLVLDPDPAGRSATLTVRTTIDVACAVIYGADASFGSIATDTDMSGGAHRDHAPVLAGLEPDTEYLYRLQGSDAQGRLYVSETFRFRTPPAAEGGAPNLGLGARVVGVSSEYSAAFAAEYAVDGDPATEWSSAGDADEAWIEIDLGTERDIGAVAFRSRGMGDGSSVTETFSVTVDGVEHGPFPAGPEPVPLALRARVLRFDVVSSTGGNTGALDIEVLAGE